MAQPQHTAEGHAPPRIEPPTALPVDCALTVSGNQLVWRNADGIEVLSVPFRSFAALGPSSDVAGSD